MANFYIHPMKNIIYINDHNDLVIVRRNNNISTSILLFFSINTYLYNMILSEETLRYPAS